MISAIFPSIIDISHPLSIKAGRCRPDVRAIFCPLTIFFLLAACVRLFNPQSIPIAEEHRGSLCHMG